MTTIQPNVTSVKKAKAKKAEIVREFDAAGHHVHGVTFDGKRVWYALGESLNAMDPDNGKPVRSLPVRADAGTAFDGKYLYQLAEDKIQKIDPESGRVVGTIPAPAEGRDSGLTWAEGTLFVGEYRGRKIHQIDAETGKILRVIQSDRFVTGVSFVDGELWHGTWEGEHSDIRQIDPETGEVLARYDMPEGTGVSGLEADGAGLFWCGGSESGKVRAVRLPK